MEPEGIPSGYGMHKLTKGYFPRFVKEKALETTGVAGRQPQLFLVLGDECPYGIVLREQDRR